jgi:hypothetical protein
MSGDGQAPASAPAFDATLDAAKVTERAMERANDVVVSSAGRILTREGRYYERLLRQLVASAFIDGAMLGAEIATKRAVAGWTAAPAPALELEGSSSSSSEPAAPEFVDDNKTWPGGDDEP